MEIKLLGQILILGLLGKPKAINETINKIRTNFISLSPSNYGCVDV